MRPKTISKPARHLAQTKIAKHIHPPVQPKELGHKGRTWNGTPQPVAK